MTLATTSNRKEYVGDAAQTAFPYDFLVLDETHFEIYLDEVLQTLTTDYTVSGILNPAGGDITFLTAPATGVVVVLLRVVPFTQEVDLPNTGSFPSTIVEQQGFDKIMMLLQQLSEKLGRAVKLATTSTFLDILFPDPAASKFIRYNSAATALEAVDIVPLGSLGVPVSITDGGTGATTKAAAQTSLGIGGEDNNLFKGGSVESWSAGASAAPDGWVLAGAGAAVAREGTIIKHGLFSAKLTRSGTDCRLTRDCYVDMGSTYVRSREFTFGAWVYATVASRARLRIHDGVTQSLSSYHTGGSSWEFLTLTVTAGAAVTAFSGSLFIDTGDTSAYIDGANLVEGELSPAFASHPNDEHLKAVAYQDTTPTNFDYGLLRAETGIASTSAGGLVTITFGTPFSKILDVIGSTDNLSSAAIRSVSFSSKAVDSVDVQAVSSGDARQVAGISWLAIGVE